ncbi:MAG: ABA4-like family protein [Pontixanthobacter sp.]
MWDTIFNAANMLALVAWIALILLPRKPALLAGIMYCGIALLCLIYSAGLVAVLTGLVSNGGAGEEAGFSSIAGVRAIFASDSGVTIGWVHYLAFDLFVGLWIARNADAKGFARWVQAPILSATFLAGPLGLFIWLIIREKRARVAAKASTAA